MTLKYFYLLVILIGIPSQTCIAFQKVQTTSRQDEYQLLADQFYKSVEDSLFVEANSYANQYLSIAKDEKDTTRIADGFYFLSRVQKGETSLRYSDSIIQIVQNSPTAYYPTYAYLNKATIHYNEGKFKKSFDYFLKVNEEAIKYDNTFLLYNSKKNIGILKGILGENESALVTLKECYAFYVENRKYITNEEYLEILFALSESYNFNKVLDSASTINTIGYKESLIAKNEKFRSYFILNEGINHFSKKNYPIAKDSLQKAITLLKSVNETTNLGQAYFYLGKTLSQLEQPDKAIEKHKNADEIFQKSLKIIPESRENYEILIQYYKEIGDKDEQLVYIEKLLGVDSILDDNYKYLIKNVVQNYDTPRLLAEKQEIIDALETDKKSSFITTRILYILSFILAVFLIWNYLKRKKYKKRFLELYNTNSSSKKPNENKVASTELASLDIPEVTIKEILNGLEKFEENLGFLKPKIVTNDLAKKMNTNSKYLSKVVNHYKKKSFSMYINELRIDYCVERLKTDRKFANYTVKAIAREIGFNSVDAFSKSFFKIKGIQPSYFIRELEKIQQNKESK